MTVDRVGLRAVAEQAKERPDGGLVIIVPTDVLALLADLDAAETLLNDIAETPWHAVYQGFSADDRPRCPACGHVVPCAIERARTWVATHHPEPVP